MQGKIINKKNKLFQIGIIFLACLACFLLVKQPKKAVQAIDPIFPLVKFEGEYRLEGGEWEPISKDEHISSRKGDVFLRGYFKLLNPETGEVLGNASTGMYIAVYLNHLNLSLYDNENVVYMTDTENSEIGIATCGQVWDTIPIIDEAKPLTICLRNPHTYGNENAINEFLNSPAVYIVGEFEKEKMEDGSFQRNIGIAVAIVSIAIFGVSIFASQIRVKNSKELAVIGSIILFAGGYYFFSSTNISLVHNNYRINTTILCMCKELYILFSTMILWKVLTVKTMKVGKVLLGISLVALVVLWICTLPEWLCFYDSWCLWSVIECFVCVGLILCLLLEVKESGKENLHIYAVAFCLLLSYLVDYVAGCLGWWDTQFLSMLFFFFIFAVAVLLTLRILPQQMVAVAKNKELEMEKKILQAELKESRISVMMSQIQPHFLYNSLAVIQELCHEEPEKAEKAIGNLAEFLKGNMSILLSDKVVSFADELNHTKKYLEMEYLRFEDQLSVVYEINTDNFCLPALTLQPIVENAVRYGVRKNEDGGMVRITTNEYKEFYEVIVEDDGPGLNPEEFYQGEGMHIGIKNVRERLAHMCGGELIIESTQGKGTKVFIRISRE